MDIKIIILLLILLVIVTIVIVAIIGYHRYKKHKCENNMNCPPIEGGANSDKPVIILFNGFASSKLFWEYAYNGTSELQPVTFMKKLKKIGEVHTFDLPFFNINYYIRPDSPKDAKIWDTINEKYKPYDNVLDFTLEDLDYENICKKVHQEVHEKYGSNRKYILIGHSYGGPLALLYSKLYKQECSMCVCIDNAPYVLKFFQKYNEKENKTLVTKINTNLKLSKLLKIIKTSDSMTEKNEAGNKVMNLIGRLSALDRIKYYDEKLYVPTIFFKSQSLNPGDMDKIRTRFNRKEKKQFATNPNFKYYKFYKGAEHYIWNNEKFANNMIKTIKKFL